MIEPPAEGAAQPRLGASSGCLCDADATSGQTQRGGLGHRVRVARLSKSAPALPARVPAKRVAQKPRKSESSCADPKTTSFRAGGGRRDGRETGTNRELSGRVAALPAAASTASP